MRLASLLAVGLAGVALSLPFTACSGSTDLSASPDAAACDDRIDCEGAPLACPDGTPPFRSCERNAAGKCAWKTWGCSDSGDASDAADAGDAIGASDAGDAGDARDAADAPACPTLMPTRLSKCDSLDQLCIYACGTVLRCTAKGWDDDFTVDGGPPCP